MMQTVAEIMRTLGVAAGCVILALVAVIEYQGRQDEQTWIDAQWEEIDDDDDDWSA